MKQNVFYCTQSVIGENSFWHNAHLKRTKWKRARRNKVYPCALIKQKSCASVKEKLLMNASLKSLWTDAKCLKNLWSRWFMRIVYSCTDQVIRKCKNKNPPIKWKHRACDFPCIMRWKPWKAWISLSLGNNAYLYSEKEWNAINRL